MGYGGIKVVYIFFDNIEIKIFKIRSQYIWTRLIHTVNIFLPKSGQKFKLYGFSSLI